MNRRQLLKGAIAAALAPHVLVSEAAPLPVIYGSGYSSARLALMEHYYAAIEMRARMQAAFAVFVEPARLAIEQELNSKPRVGD